MEKAQTTSKINELMNNEKIQEIILEPNGLFDNMLKDDGDNQSEIESKIETLLCHLNNFMFRHGVN